MNQLPQNESQTSENGPQSPQQESELRRFGKLLDEFFADIPI